MNSTKTVGFYCRAKVTTDDLRQAIIKYELINSMFVTEDIQEINVIDVRYLDKNLIAAEVCYYYINREPVALTGIYDVKELLKY